MGSLRSLPLNSTLMLEYSIKMISKIFRRYLMELPKKWHYSWWCPTPIRTAATTVIGWRANRFESLTSFIYFAGNGGVRSRPASRTASYIESKSPGFINTRLVNYNRGVSYAPSMHSHSMHHPEPENIPPPSSEEEKSKTTRRYIATISAVSYAIFLVIFGLIAFIGNAVQDQHPIPEVSKWNLDVLNVN